MCVSVQSRRTLCPVIAGTIVVALSQNRRMNTSALFDNAFAKKKYWTLDDLATTTNPTQHEATEVAEVAQTAILQLRCDCVKLALVSGKQPLNQKQQWLGKMRQVCEFLCAAAAAASKDNGENKADPSLSHNKLELLVSEASKAIDAFSNL